ncbi:MAG TPA: DUF1552 domain-containing protein [Vicinamibacterales bacterium]|nr:DUF1552 domain-containing protein [Vicinamibacterales bacterium]
MYLTQRHLSRRAVLKGMGVTLALPFLDAMTPAGLTGTASAATRQGGTTRLVAMEMVHGSAGSAPYGLQQHMWSPAAAGRNFDLTPTSLVSLEPYRDDLTIVSNTMDHSAEAWSAPEIGGDHFRSSATYLTQAHPKQTEGSDIDAGTSLDQVYAKRFGQDTAIPSMQLCIEPVDQAGGCDYGYACVYTDTLSWSSPTEPLPAIRNPRAVFNQLFGLGGTPQDRTARRKAKASILDWLTVQIADMQKTLGASDRRRFDSYLTDVREIERRIQNVEAHNSSGAQRELPEAPVGVPDSFHEHVHLMMDLIAAAFQSDLTRVFSFKLGRDASARVYPGAGGDAASAAFHPTSHHQEKPDNLKVFQAINSYHVSMVPYLLAKLKSIQEPNGSLLDNSVILYGSPMGDSNVHNHRRLPLFLLGHAGGRLHGHVHIKAPDDTPMANAWLAVLQTLGVDKDKFGDSREAMDLNPAVEATTADREGL